MSEIKLNLAPTLLIGLGGTGKDVLLRVRQLFFERYGLGTDGALGYPIIGYLVLDTDPAGLGEQGGGKDTSTFVSRNIRFRQAQIPESVYCRVTGDQCNQYFREGNQLHPHVFRWMPTEMNQYAAGGMEAGAGQNRPLGRLAFFHYYRGTGDRPGIREVLERRLANIIPYATDPQKLKRWKPEGAEVARDRVEVVIIYSLAGGTGAGMFLDMGMVVRDVLSKNHAGLDAHLTHFAVMPEVMVGPKGPLHSNVLQRDKVQENAFTALRELEYFAIRRGYVGGLAVPPRPDRILGVGGMAPLYVAQWQKDPVTNEPISTAVYGAPWNTLYLVGASNDPLQDTLTTNDMNQMIADHLFLNFDPSEFGAKKRSARSNLIQQLSDHMLDHVVDEAGKRLYARPLSRAFSIFGLSMIEFDRARMRRAASYRLAGRLVREWWLRRNKPSATDLARLGQEDLSTEADPRRPEAAPAVTRTAPGEQVVRLDTNSLLERLMRIDGQGDRTWAAELRDQYEALLRAAEAELAEGRPIDVRHYDPFTGWREDHDKRLSPPPRGSVASEAGIVLKTFEANRKDVEEEIRRRMRHLFLYRLQMFGVPDTQDLLKEYADQNLRRLHSADKASARAVALPAEWDRRLQEARRLWLRPYARIAAKLELIRAIHAMFDYLARRYKKEASVHMKACLERIQRLLADNVPEGSYVVALRTFREMLEKPHGVLAHLDDRFKELRARGENSGRVIGLLSKLDDSEYDRRILRAIAPDRTSVPWEEVERQILKGVAESDPKLADVHSLGGLILRYVPLDQPMPVSLEDLRNFAQYLAGACEGLLVNFERDTKALELFKQQPDQTSCLENLRVYSSPFLRRNQRVGAEISVDTNRVTYLGVNKERPDQAERFKQDLLSSGEKDRASLGQVEDLDMKDDALVLYQEKAGIPLSYFQGLDHLGSLYDRSNRKAETHFDYPYLRDRLPEIRQVDQKKQTLLAQCVELTLYGIVTGKRVHSQKGAIRKAWG